MHKRTRFIYSVVRHSVFKRAGKLCVWGYAHIIAPADEPFYIYIAFILRIHRVKRNVKIKHASAVFVR